MSTAELKVDLINKITNITDEIKLREIFHLLTFQSDNSIFVTSNEDKKAIMEARAQMANGETVSNEEVQTEIRKWIEQ